MRARHAIAILLGLTSAAHAERFYFRGGVVHVAPQTDSTSLELADVKGIASLAVQNGPVEGSGTDVSSSTVVAAIVGYVLPIGGRTLSIETVIGMPFQVKFRTTGKLATESLAPMALGVPTGIPPLGSELGEATVAPPVVTVVYRPRLGRWRPFGGAGVGMLFAYDAHITNSVLTAVREPDLSLTNAVGLALQAGIEARLWRRVYARLDLKYIAFLESQATVEHIAVKTTIPIAPTVEVGTARVGVTVNPVIVQAGVGADF